MSDSLADRIKLTVKKWLFPGPDLHTRSRMRHLTPLIRGGDIETLDAGFGNGAMSLAAYRKGNRVLGISIWQDEVDRTQALFDFMRVPRDRVNFQLLNIYDLDTLNRTFDQIICSETLEHITRDQEVITLFSHLLRPGGQLILCCPHAIHPEHNLGRTNEPETGYHVRDGYTRESYSHLLSSTDLRITRFLGIGSPRLAAVDKRVRSLRHRLGQVLSLPFVLVALPAVVFDREDPSLPFSLVVVAEKPRPDLVRSTATAIP